MDQFVLKSGCEVQMASPDFRLLFESAPAALVVVDPEFHVVDATDAYLRATQTEREAILGRDLSEVVADTGNLRASLETVLRTGEPHTMDVQKHGVRDWSPVNTPVLKDGRVAYIMHAIEDVTSRTRVGELERDAAQNTSEMSILREADRTKDEFIAIISHELRTPMTSILGWSRMLALGGLDEATRIEALDALERSTLAQAKLIEDLLDESRIAAGRLRLDMRPMTLRAVAESAVSMLRPAADAKTIALTLQGADACEVVGDPSRLQQSIANLIGNAIKFTPEGGTVTVRVRCDGESGVVDVIDNGRGISPALLPHIFERFKQGTLTGDRQGGLGLGLSISRHLVEMHGGTIGVTSGGEGQGSTFTIRLPLYDEAGAGDVLGRDAAARAAALPILGGVRVLIVEDDVDNRKVLATALRHCGAAVVCVATAGGAFNVVPQFDPDVIICDIALPDTDGCDFLKRIRSGDESATTQAPALALTVLGRPGEQERITAAGFDVFRQKPIDPIDLAHETARLARRAKA